MDLKEAKDHMLAHGECWQFYTKRMDPMSRDTMVAEQKRLMREGHKVSTPQTYALACMGMMMFDGREIPLSPEMKSALQVSEGSERTAEVSPLASAGSDLEPDKPFSSPEWKAWKGRQIAASDKEFKDMYLQNPTPQDDDDRPRYKEKKRPAETHEQIEGDQRRFV